MLVPLLIDALGEPGAGHRDPSRSACAPFALSAQKS
jgi:hypothetical protein